MSIFLDKLEGMGCDVKGAMARFLNDEDFYKECYKQCLEDKAFIKLKAALDAQDLKAAFDYAHTLKGLMANMGLTPVYELTAQMVEPLRIGESAGVCDTYEAMMKLHGEFQSLCDEYCN